MSHDRERLFANVPAPRRRIMQAIRSTGTRPERMVRSLLQRMGYRFRKNLRKLPGAPDVVFTARRKVVFVHGCFWHSHPNCRNAAVPKTREGYWIAKLARTAERDAEHVAALAAMGWEADIVWECELDDAEKVKASLQSFLGPVASMPRSS